MSILLTIGICLFSVFSILAVSYYGLSDNEGGNYGRLSASDKVPENWGWFEKFIGWGKMSMDQRNMFTAVFTTLFFIVLFGGVAVISVFMH